MSYVHAKILYFEVRGYFGKLDSILYYFHLEMQFFSRKFITRNKTFLPPPPLSLSVGNLWF